MSKQTKMTDMKSVHVYLSDDEYELLEKFADSSLRSKSNLARILVAKGLERLKNEEDSPDGILGV